MQEEEKEVSWDIVLMVTAVCCSSKASSATILIVTSKFTVIENTIKADLSAHSYL